jgi:hypothetical protein
MIAGHALPTAKLTYSLTVALVRNSYKENQDKEVEKLTLKEMEIIYKTRRNTKIIQVKYSEKFKTFHIHNNNKIF